MAEPGARMKDGWTWDERAYQLIEDLSAFDTSSYGPVGRIETINAMRPLIARALSLIEEYNTPEENTTK